MGGLLQFSNAVCYVRAVNSLSSLAHITVLGIFSVAKDTNAPIYRQWLRLVVTEGEMTLGDRFLIRYLPNLSGGSTSIVRVIRYSLNSRYPKPD